MSTRRLITNAALAVTLVAVSFWLGFREGAKVGVMVDAIPRGGISLSLLDKASKQGVTRNMVISFEGDVDMALLWGHQVEQHPLRAAFEPLWGIPVPGTQESLVRLATYRRSHPSPLAYQVLASEPVPGDPEGAAIRRELLSGAQENDRIISAMVAKYAPSGAQSK